MYRYEPLGEPYTGRIDGETLPHLRWHQVVELINLDEEEDLSKGFCILGFKSDKGVKKNKGRTGAFYGPDVIRQQLASLPWHFGRVKIYDAGNVICEGGLEKAQELYSGYVKKALEKGLFVIGIGGGHEIAYGSINGWFQYKNSFPFVVNFDAHFDLRPIDDGRSSGNSFSAIYELSRQVNKPFDYFAIGIQKAANTPYLYDVAKKISANWIELDEIIFNTAGAVEKIKKILKGVKNSHLTICMDVFEGCLVEGVSAQLPFGLDNKRFLELFYTVLEYGNVKSFDIAEVAPPLERGALTSKLAAHIIFRLVDFLVSRKKF